MKRAFAIGAAAIALALVPAAAQAYPAPPAVITVNDPTPGVNTPVVFTISDLEGAETATATVTSWNPATPNSAIEIAGVAALTKDVVDESVTFTVRFATDGVYTTTITTDNGIEIPAQVITVGAGDSTGAGSGDSADGGSKLPDTGSNGMVGIAALGGGLLVAGGAGVYLVRRNNQKAV